MKSWAAGEKIFGFVVKVKRLFGII